LKKTSLNSNDIVYEIGPGEGIITEQLAKICSKVITFEKDEELYKNLVEKFKNYENIEIYLGDFLEKNVNFKNTKVFSNIPFNITADIIKKLIKVENSPTDTYLFVQKEAARKYLGKPKETLVSLLIKPWFDLKTIHDFSPKDFSPTPSVDVTLLHIEKRDEFLVENKNSQLYKDFIAYSLSQWEPNVEKTFKRIFTYKQIHFLSKNLEFKKESRITDLNFKQILDLFDFFLHNIDIKKKKVVFNYQKKLEKQQRKLKKIHRSRTDRNWKEK